MEEASLDDFFAKKDKGKKKKKTATGDILDADKPKKSAKKKKDKDKSNQSNTGTSEKPVKSITQDNEWNDYKEEEEKDFSDLKLANLQIGNRDADDDTERAGEGSGDDDVDGEGRDRKEGPSGPWNNVAATGTEGAEPEPAPKPPTPPPEPAPKTTGKYIPPSVRRAMEAGGASPSAPSSSGPGYGRRKPKVAPDVSSELDFPTLGGGPALKYGGSGQAAQAQFEQVRGGGRHVEDPRLQTGRVEIGNKFDALTSDD